jgi:hypothetical protein
MVSVRRSDDAEFAAAYRRQAGELGWYSLLVLAALSRRTSRRIGWVKISSSRLADAYERAIMVRSLIPSAIGEQ